MTSALLLALFLACGDKDDDTGTPVGDGGSADGGSQADGGTDGGSEGDGGSSDGGSSDGGSADGGSADGGSADGGSADGGSTDGGSADGGSEGDGGSADGGSTDGGSTDGGSSDGGGEGDGGSDATLASGTYILSVGELIADSCVAGGSGEAIPEGASTDVAVTVSGEDARILLTGGMDIDFNGTLSGGVLDVSQATTTDFSRMGYDCVLQYTWWIRGNLVSDDHVEGSLGLDYTPFSGSECDALAAADGWTFPCGWSVEAALEPAR